MAFGFMSDHTQGRPSGYGFGPGILETYTLGAAGWPTAGVVGVSVGLASVANRVPAAKAKTAASAKLYAQSNFTEGGPFTVMFKLPLTNVRIFRCAQNIIPKNSSGEKR